MRVNKLLEGIVKHGKSFLFLEEEEMVWRIYSPGFYGEFPNSRCFINGKEVNMCLHCEHFLSYKRGGCSLSTFCSGFSPNHSKYAGFRLFSFLTFLMEEGFEAVHPYDKGFSFYHEDITLPQIHLYLA